MSDSWPDQIAHFKAMPWCAKVLSEPGIVTMPPVSRHYDPDDPRFEFWAVTLHSSATIPFFVGCFHVPDVTEPSEEPDQRPLEERFVTKIRFFLTLGHGLSTISKDWVHGGAVATIFDECAGSVGYVNKMHGLMEPLPQVTQNINLTYLRPVPTMTTVVVTATLARVEEDSKKFVVDAELSNEEGVVLAKAEILYIPVVKRRTKKEKL